jgi:anti-sigma regulatory factor (Ser/Thr protein kinase)
MWQFNLTIKLKNRLKDLDVIKKAVEGMGATIDCTHRRFKEIDLILEELFTNVVNHGFSDDKEHDIVVDLKCDNDRLEIRMEDDGKPFDLSKKSAPDTRCALEQRYIGGLGIHLIKHFIDKYNYSRKNGKNIIVLEKFLNPCSKKENEKPSREKSI